MIVESEGIAIGFRTFLAGGGLGVSFCISGRNVGSSPMEERSHDGELNVVMKRIGMGLRTFLVGGGLSGSLCLQVWDTGSSVMEGRSQEGDGIVMRLRTFLVGLCVWWRVGLSGSFRMGLKSFRFFGLRGGVRAQGSVDVIAVITAEISKIPASSFGGLRGSNLNTSSDGTSL